MRPRPPDGQSVLSPLAEFIPHNRVRGAEADRGQSGTFAGKHGHWSSQRHAVACTGGCSPGCRISVAVNFRGVGGTTFPFTLCLQIQLSQASKGLIFNFRFRTTLRASNQVVVGLANREWPAICASRPVTAYISAAWRNGSDLTAGRPFPVVSTERFPVPSTSLSNLYDGRPADHIFSRVADLLNHFMMHSFCVGGPPNTFVTGAAVDESTKSGGWKTESTA